MSLLIFASFIHFCYFIAIRKNKNDFADIAWGLGFVLLAVVSLIEKVYELGSASVSSVTFLVVLMVSIWGIRLFLYLYKRNINKPEDDRYQKMKLQWKSKVFLHSYFKVFVFQGILILIIALPFLVLIKNPEAKSPVLWLSVLGVMIWLVGFLFEVIADAQMSKFKNNPLNKGKIITSGLWSISRHPNYFGEILVWWGIFLTCLSETQNGWTMISPLLITFLIVKVSGVPLLEKKYEGRSDFEEYKKKTSKLIPFL